MSQSPYACGGGNSTEYISCLNCPYSKECTDKVKETHMGQLAFDIEETDTFIDQTFSVVERSPEYKARQQAFWTAVNSQPMVLDWAIETGEIYENVNDLKVDLQVVVDWFKAGMPLRG